MFVLWQLLAVAFWLLPQSAIQQGLLPVLRPYMWLTGGWQNWNMFSPNPANLDVFLSANITYKDGTTRTWVFPRMTNQSYLERYQDERFRKMIENAHLDANQAVWPYVARFAGIANNFHPAQNPVVHVELVRSWQVIGGPGSVNSRYASYMFYRTDYAPGALPGADSASGK